MAEYTLLNLKDDIENMAERLGLALLALAFDASGDAEVVGGFRAEREPKA